MAVLLQFLVPVIAFFISVGSIVALVLGAINNPEGAVNTFLIRMIDNVAFYFPSTPNNLKIGSLLGSVANMMPIVGQAIVYDIAQTIAAIFSIMAVIKIYKLIPFKSS